MASLRVLAFDPEGRPVAFDTWPDDLQLYLLSDLKDSVSLFDHVSGAAPAPPATADVSTRSQWLSRDATARLAIRNHLPATECAHFGEHRTAQALYNDVVARYSSPTTAAIGRLLLPYLFPKLSAFATVADLVTHLRTSDARYRATVPPEFLPTKQPPMFITLYFIVTRLPDSLCSVRDHFLTLDPTSLTVDLLEQHLLAAETSAVATSLFLRTSVLLRLVRSAKGGRGSGGGSGGGGGGSGSGNGGSGRGGGGGGGGGGSGTGGGSGGSGGGGGGSGGSGGNGGGGTGGGRSRPRHGGPGGGRGLQQQRRSETQTPQQLHEWLVQRGTSEGIETCPYVICTGVRAGQTCGSAEGDCYRCVPPDPGIVAAALGASASGTPPGTTPAEALHTFTLDSGASRCFFRDRTTLTPLPKPVPFRLADPSGGPVVARSSTVLPCPAVPSGSLSRLHLPSFSTNLVSTATLLDAMVTTTTPGGLSLYTLATEPPQTLFWHHRLGHPSLPRLCGMHSRLLVSGLPRSLPALPPSPAPPCLPCVEGQQRAAPHSSSFPPTTAPQQTLHMDVWGPARVSGQGRERYFLLVVDDYTRYTKVFPLRSKGEVSDVLIPWIRTVRLQLLERFGQDLPVLCLHSDRGAPHWLSHGGRSYLHDPCGRSPFSVVVCGPVRCASAQPLAPCLLAGDLAHTALDGEGWRCVAVRVWGSRAFVRDTSADKLSARAIPCIFLGFVPDAPGWQFYHPTSRRVLPFQDVTFDESVPFYHLGPGGADSEGAESGSAEPRGAASSGGPAGASPRLSSQQLREWLVRHPHRRSGAPGAGGARDTAGGGAAGPTGGVGCAGAGDPKEPGAAGAVGAGAGVAGVGGPGVGGAGAAGAGQVLGVPSTGLPPPFLCPPPDQSQPPLQLASPLPAPSPYTKRSGGLTERCESASRPVSPVRTARRAPRSRPPPVPGTHTMALRPSSVPLRVPLPAPPESSLPEVPDPESDRTRAASPTVARLLATADTDPYFESATASTLIAELLDFAVACRLDYATALVAESVSPSPPSVRGECALGTDVLEDRQEDFECLAGAVPRFASMLLAPEGDSDAPDIPTPRSYAEAITGPYSSQWQAAMDAEMASWKSTGTYVDKVPPPGANIVDGMWIFRGIDYFHTFSPTLKMTTLRVLLHVAAQRDYELHSLDFSTPFLQSSLHEEIWLRRPPGFTRLFPAGTQWSLWRPIYGLRQVPREWHETLRTTLVALGFAPSTDDASLFLRTDTSLPPFYILVYVNNLVFATTDTEALTLVKSELQKRHTCTDLGEVRSYLGLQITRDRARRTSTLTLSHTVHQVLHRFEFQFSSPQLTPFSTSHSLSAPPSDESVEPTGLYPKLVGCLMYLMTCTRPDLTYPLSLLARYVAHARHRKVHWDVAKRVLRYLCSTSGMGLVLGGRGPVVLNGHADAFWVDDSTTQRSSQGYTFSIGSGSVSWRSTRLSSVLSSSCEAEIYAGAMAAQELRWLTYLLTDLGEQPRSPPVLYVDVKAMIALCQEHGLEHRTKHIALRYFLARELQQRGQLHLAYVATRANTADVFTKALPLGDHQRFATVLGLVLTLPHLLTA
ncbi:unnamed protein product [Closterium sp. NIES-53]